MTMEADAADEGSNLSISEPLLHVEQLEGIKHVKLLRTLYLGSLWGSFGAKK